MPSCKNTSAATRGIRCVVPNRTAESRPSRMAMRTNEPDTRARAANSSAVKKSGRSTMPRIMRVAPSTRNALAISDNSAKKIGGRKNIGKIYTPMHEARPPTSILPLPTLAAEPWKSPAISSPTPEMAAEARWPGPGAETIRANGASQRARQAMQQRLRRRSRRNHTGVSRQKLPQRYPQRPVDSNRVDIAGGCADAVLTATHITPHRFVCWIVRRSHGLTAFTEVNAGLVGGMCFRISFYVQIVIKSIS